MMAQQCDLEVGDFVWTGGDCHLYLNHLEQAELQLSRTPYPLPQLKILRKPASLFDYDVRRFRNPRLSLSCRDQSADRRMKKPHAPARTPLFEVRHSRVHGYGVFALRRIRKGTNIIEYLGDRMSHE